MKRLLVAALAALAIGTAVFEAPAIAQVYPAIGGDVTDVLGNNPIFPYGLRASVLNQQAAGQFAQRAALVAGTYTFTFAKAYNSIPACTVTGEAGANINTIRAVPSTSSVVVTSYSAASTVATTDTQFVDIHCDGNPN